jgi:aryl-alcohol dehydrogenase-like predicted oxidoreductase
MDYRALGRTGVKVSRLCLGTMTFGEQNSEAEGHAQMDYAFDRGINIFDAAEIYPIPPKPETQGRTEAIIASWLAARKARDKVVIATKVAGRGKMVWVRRNETATRQSPGQIMEAVEASLKRLKTDHIDLTSSTGPTGQCASSRASTISISKAMAIRSAISSALWASLLLTARCDSSVFRTRRPGMSFLKAAEHPGLPRPASIQNAYNLVNRSFQIGLSEVACREEVSLLPLSQREV